MGKRQTLTRKLCRRAWDELAVRDAILETALPGASKLVLLAVVSHRGTKSRRPAVSVRRLAALASVNKDTPARVLAALERDGLIRQTREHGRAAAVFDLDALPQALARLLSGLEGQALSDAKGQALSEREGQAEARPCPLSQDGSVPSGTILLSVQEGSKEQRKEQRKEHLATPEASDTQVELPIVETKPPSQPVAKSRGRSKPKPKRTPEQHAAYERVLQAHKSIVLEATGEEPSPEHSAAWKLLDAVAGNADTAIARIRVAVGKGQYGTTSLAKIASMPNAYMAQKQNGQRVQGGDVSKFLEQARKRAAGAE